MISFIQLSEIYILFTRFSQDLAHTVLYLLALLVSSTSSYTLKFIKPKVIGILSNK